MYQNSGNILMISESEHDLNLFRSQFVDFYNIFTAASTREGHRLMKEYDVHVVLVKQKMAEMTGLQFGESISNAYPHVITIVLTEEEDTESLERAVQKKMLYRYLRFPYEPTDMKMVLEGALKLSESEYQNRQLSDELQKYKSDRENILKLFKRYVPAEVVTQALDTKEDQLMSPGESRVVSVLFADIRGFTQFASHLRPSQIVNFLNYYWQEVSECVKKNKGSVNKYMGDGLLAVFGAPVSHIDNHKNAVSAALDMIERLHDINKKYADLLGTEIKIGVGINSGEVVVGNIGTDSYMEYTVIGNTVNVASRMEAISKKKPNSIIISESTHRLVHDAFEVSEVREATVKDEEQKVSHYEVLGHKSKNIYNIRPGREQT